jgi:2-oxo-4-hydroxy-4-carboxy--5-ureidoimidazoline (OHCU) decarboxylase
MFKNFLMRKMISRQLDKASIPEAEKEKFLRLVENNPDLVQKLAVEAQVKIKEGKDQMSAMMEVMQTHREEIQKAME